MLYAIDISIHAIIVAIVDCTHEWSATASFKVYLCTGEQYQQRVDVLVEDNLEPSLDFVTVDQEGELHKQNS